MEWLIELITERPVMFARYVCYAAVAIAAIVCFIIKRNKKTPHYSGFEKWLDEQIPKCDLHKVIAFNFNLYEDNGGKWSVELVGTRVFSENDSDWACSEAFTTRDDPYVIEHKGDYKAVLAVFKECVLKYLDSGRCSEQLKSKAAVGIGFVDGDIEILYKQPEQKSPTSARQFPYAVRMPVDIVAEVIEQAKAANENFRFVNRRDTQGIIEQIQEKADGYIGGKKIPKAYTDMQDVAIALGSRFAFAYIQERNWRWAMVGDSEETAQVCIISPKQNYCIFPLLYMRDILMYGKVNNVLLLWNMTADIDDRPTDKKLTPLS